jgi:hypothetical protein
MSLDVTDSNARFIDNARIGYAVDAKGAPAGSPP